MQQVKDLLFKLLEVKSISGFEEPMMRALKEELMPLCDEVYDTPRGNVIGVQKGTDPTAPKIALAAHTDQVGFIVFNIDAKGFIRFKRVGGAVHRSIQGHQMELHGSKRLVYGVVGIKPGHITKPSEANIVPPIEKMYIDVGANSREEVNKMGITIGTTITWRGAPVELANNFVATAAADDRAGLAAIISVARNLKDKSIPSTVYYIGTVEEEIGLRGAEVATYGLDVDIAFAIDTCPAGYQPDVPQIEILYEVGKGPCMQIGETGSRGIKFSSEVLRRWLMEVADENKIPYQTGIMFGGTDASAMQQTMAGLHAMAFSIPRRYSHSPVEVLSMDDLNNLIRILSEAIPGVDSGFNLHRI